MRLVEIAPLDDDCDQAWINVAHVIAIATVLLDGKLRFNVICKEGREFTVDQGDFNSIKKAMDQ